MLSSLESTRMADSSKYKRPVTLIPFVSKEERQDLDDISISAKDGHSFQTKHCEMCVKKHRPCWTPHQIRYSGC